MIKTKYKKQKMIKKLSNKLLGKQMETKPPKLNKDYYTNR